MYKKLALIKGKLMERTALIKSLFRKYGIKQIDLCRKYNLSVAYMSMVVNGKRFGHKYLDVIAAATFRDPDELKSMPYNGRD